MNVALLVLGGAIGAILRYLLDKRIQGWHDSPFPWGTLTVNVSGSLILGLLAGAVMFGMPSDGVRALFGIGLSGALTTFSTFGYETTRLFADGARLYAIANVIISVLAGLGSALCGVLLAAAIWS